MNSKRTQAGDVSPPRRVISWRVRLPTPRERTGTSFSRLLIYAFAGLIVIGGLILMLPVSSAAGQPTPPVNAFFTSTSAVCVTGLVVVDTGTYWSAFGQGVILALIQIGGFGFMTSTTLLLLAFGRRIGLRERLLIGQSIGLARLGGVVGVVKRMAIFTALTEVIGAVLLFIRFSAYFPARSAVWKSVFHSISAFNNAGFDVLGNFQSLKNYQTDVGLLLLTAALIFLGGISYLVLSDLIRVRKLSKLTLDSKLVLSTTVILLVGGIVVMLITEFADPAAFGSLTVPQKGLCAFFQFLMFVGGASGSTAGGIKLNTFGILAATVWSTVRGREDPAAFGREFNKQQIYRALAVIMLSLGVVVLAVLLLTIYENTGFIQLLFETISAFATVGLTTGITPGLSMAGKLIITVTMFVGRLGPLAMTMALLQRQQPSSYRYPEEIIRIG
jgi:trk system potassium uptake protein TrkH